MPSQLLTQLTPPHAKQPVRVLHRRRAAFGLDHAARFDKDAARRALTQWLGLVLPDACVLHGAAGDGALRIADVTVLLASGRCIFFDLAPQRGKTRRGENAFADFCSAARIPHARVRNVAEARAALRRFGILIREVA